MEEAGVPIGSEAGVGYFLAENYNLPPVMFTNEEATALLFGSKFIEQMSDEVTKCSFESALFKIKSVLKNSEKDYLENLDEHITVFTYSNSDDTKKLSFLSEIRKAIVAKKRLKIEYHTQYSDEVSKREIIPIGLTHYGISWHLIAFCQKRKDYRDFRIDRIKKLITLDVPFDKSKYLSLEQYLEKMKSQKDLPEIVLVSKKESLRFIKDSKYWYGYTHEDDIDENFVRMYFRNADLFGFSRWVILGGSNVKVEAPEELKQMVLEFAHELKEHLL